MGVRSPSAHPQHMVLPLEKLETTQISTTSNAALTRKDLTESDKFQAAKSFETLLPCQSLRKQ